MRIALASLIALAAAGAAFAQEAPPPACRPDAENVVDWTACLEAAQAGSKIEAVARANLGTEAYFDGDLGTAAAQFDRTVEILGAGDTGDPFLNAFRAATYDAVGRHEQARRDIDVVVAAIDGGGLPADAVAALYEIVLPAMSYGDHPRLPDALQRYDALPAAGFDAALDRAVVLAEAQAYDRAEAHARRALQERPEDPDALAVMCWIQPEADSVDICRKAVAASPDDPVVQADFAAALAAAGRCEEARQAVARLDAIAPREDGTPTPFACGEG